jgi:N-acetyl-1-D-myo-inositol-2-amino-2-deoxy-alpha-D-glucopyranoside deacetylase
MARVVDAVAAVVVRVDPDVVVTLDESGGDGHRDHARIAEATIAAVRQQPNGAALYSWCVVRSLLVRWLDHQRATSPDRAYLELDPAGLGRPDEAVTTVVDATDLVPLRQQAVALHRSQVSPYEGLPADLAEAFLRQDFFVRHEPPWEGGPRETALRLRAQDAGGPPARA